MGWMPLIESGRQSLKEMESTWAITLKGPKYFSKSFLEGQVVQRLSDLTKTLSPTLKSSGGVQHLSVEVE